MINVFGVIVLPVTVYIGDLWVFTAWFSSTLLIYSIFHLRLWLVPGTGFHIPSERVQSSVSRVRTLCGDIALNGQSVATSWRAWFGNETAPSSAPECCISTSQTLLWFNITLFCCLPPSLDQNSSHLCHVKPQRGRQLYRLCFLLFVVRMPL